MPRPKQEIPVSLEVKFLPCPPEKAAAMRAGLLLLLNLIRAVRDSAPEGATAEVQSMVDSGGSE